MSSENRIVECPSCGASYDIDEVKCPYCGSINPVGAEKAYMGKLHGMERDMETLIDEGKSATVTEARETLTLVLKALSAVIVVAILIFSVWAYRNNEKKKLDEKRYQWKLEHYAEFDRLYADKEYDKLIEKYRDNLGNREASLFEWSHYEFVYQASSMESAEDFYAVIDMDNLTDHSCYSLLSSYVTYINLDCIKQLTEDDKAYLREQHQETMDKIAELFPLTDEENEAFRQDMMKYNMPMSKHIKAYLKKFCQEKGIEYHEM